LFFKKGDKHRIENYRPIYLTSNVAKIFSKVINERLKSQYNISQAEEQAGFRSGYSTSTNLQIINQLVEKSLEYKFELHMAFIDYRKAFDTIKHPNLLEQ